MREENHDSYSIPGSRDGNQRVVRLDERLFRKGASRRSPHRRRTGTGRTDGPEHPLRGEGTGHLNTKWERFEVMLPRQFNDGRDVPAAWLSLAVLEIGDRFGAASYETQVVEGR